MFRQLTFTAQPGRSGHSGTSPPPVVTAVRNRTTALDYQPVPRKRATTHSDSKPALPAR
jgi:hypothetical protein